MVAEWYRAPRRVSPARQMVTESRVTSGVDRQEWQDGMVRQAVVVFKEVCERVRMIGNQEVRVNGSHAKSCKFMEKVPLGE